MNTTGKNGYEPIVERLRLGPNDGEEPIIIVTVLLMLTAISPTFAALRAEPINRSPFGQVDRFATDLFTGSAVYSYPINVPKGTNDLTPDVSLSYNSAGARELM